MPAVTTFLVKLQCAQSTVLGGVSTVRGHSASLGHIDPFWISPKLAILTNVTSHRFVLQTLRRKKTTTRKSMTSLVVLLLDVVIDSTTMRLAAANHKTEEDYCSTNSQLFSFGVCCDCDTNCPRHTGSFNIRSGDIFKRTFILFQLLTTPFIYVVIISQL